MFTYVCGKSKKHRSEGYTQKNSWHWPLLDGEREMGLEGEQGI